MADDTTEARERELDEKITMMLIRCETLIMRLRNAAQAATQTLGRI